MLCNPKENQDPVVKLFTIVVPKDGGDYSLYVIGKKVKTDTLKKIGLPETLTINNAADFSATMGQLHVCHGKAGKDYTDLARKRKGQICNYRSKVVAYLDESLEGGIQYNSAFPTSSVLRHTDGVEAICQVCKGFRINLTNSKGKTTAPGE